MKKCLDVREEVFGVAIKVGILKSESSTVFTQSQAKEHVTFVSKIEAVKLIKLFRELFSSEC